MLAHAAQKLTIRQEPGGSLTRRNIGEERESDAAFRATAATSPATLSTMGSRSRIGSAHGAKIFLEMFVSCLAQTRMIRAVWEERSIKPALFICQDLSAPRARVKLRARLTPAAKRSA